MKSEDPITVVVRGVAFDVAPEYSTERDALPHGYHVVGEPVVVDPEEAREWGVARAWDLEEMALEAAAEELGRTTLEGYRHD